MTGFTFHIAHLRTDLLGLYREVSRMDARTHRVLAQSIKGYIGRVVLWVGTAMGWGDEVGSVLRENQRLRTT
jgi:hypothetical protein